MPGRSQEKDQVFMKPADEISVAEVPKLPFDTLDSEKDSSQLECRYTSRKSRHQDPESEIAEY